MNILGVYCGIGSMMIGSKEQGYNIIAGFDNRKFCYTGTFEHNFDKPLYSDINELYSKEDLSDIDIVISHTSCGNYSKMGYIQGKDSYRKKLKDKGDIPHFIEITKFIQPKFFILDNLPGAVNAVKPEEWNESFSNYDIYFELISNYNYGNIQKGRNRLFIIGAKKELGYVFIPGEIENNKVLKDVIGDLPLEDIEELNHIHLPDDLKIGMKNTHINRNVNYEKNLTLGEWKEWIKQFPYGKRFQYISKMGELKHKPGNVLMNMNSHSMVVLGSASHGTGLYRGDTFNPLTIRERARIQGCPDTFIFKPDKIEGDYNRLKNLRLQTGKYIPYEFTSFLTQQIKDFMEGKKIKASGKRLIKNNEDITRAKFQYCNRVGYSNKEKACKFCWIGCKS